MYNKVTFEGCLIMCFKGIMSSHYNERKLEEQGMMKWFHKYSFYLRIQLSFLLFILLPLFSASLLAYIVIKDITLDKVKASQHNVINMIAHDLSKSVEDVIYSNNLVSFNKSSAFLESLKNFKDVSVLQSLKDYESLMAISEYIDLVFSKTTGMNASIFYLNQQGYIVYGNNNELDFRSLKTWVAEKEVSDWITNANPNRLQWMMADDLKVSNWRKSDTFYMAMRPVNHLYTGERLGTLFIGIPNHYFQEVMSTVNFGQIELVNENGAKVFSHVMEGTAAIAQNNQVELRSKVPITGWELIYRFSNKEITKELTYVFRIHILLIIVCLILFIFISIFIGRQLYRPLDKLRRVAENFGEGDRIVRFPVKGRDELSVLGIAFNNMLDRINRLLLNIEQEQEEKRVIELQALFAQIHPHFLLNTLNSVKCNLALGGDRIHSGQIGSLMSLLGAYMRVNEMSSLEDECRLLVDYTQIMKMRTEMDFQFHINIPEEWKGFMVPRLMLQPMVENAIIHGFSNLPDFPADPMIRVEVYGSGDALTIDVADNGKGMVASALANLHSTLEKDKEPTASNQRIGLPNVLRRLQLTFGESSSIRVYENADKGLTVSMRIPLQDGEKGGFE
jgi:two-component system sensor histidine kinase YesM